MGKESMYKAKGNRVKGKGSGTRIARKVGSRERETRKAGSEVR